MSGGAGLHLGRLKAMQFWCDYNRKDKRLPFDVINAHRYCGKRINLATGKTKNVDVNIADRGEQKQMAYVGISPDEGDIVGAFSTIMDWRDRYYPDMEIWLTEFGWDTNTSYATENACHPYGEFSARELQAMWLVRAYFMFASIGVDRCAMYMCSDLGDDATSTGKYGTSGVIARNGEFKDSYYYIYTLRNTMGDMHFAEIIDSGNENVWIYRFENDEGKSCYAVWCPTMDDIRVDGYTLNIDGTEATITQFVNGDTDGETSSLTVTDGTVTINVSEKPGLVFSK
jgi:hypothetical protein